MFNIILTTTELAKIGTELYGFAGDLMIVGSDEVIRAFNEFRYGMQDIEDAEDKSKVLTDMMMVVIKMRKDLGYTSTNIDPKDLLRIFINDLR